MSFSEFFTSSATTLWSALGWAVIHFLWQGALIGLLTAILLDGLPQRRASLRYHIASSALLIAFAAFVGTFLWLLPSSAVTTPTELLAVSSSPLILFSLPASTELDVSAVAAWSWCLGVLFMAVRHGRDWLWTRRLKTVSVSEPAQEVRVLFESIKRELGIDRTVRFLQSSLAEAPMVVGFIAPVVLVPLSALTNLTPDQLRAVLAHELAHIRRHDHLWNLVQCVIESLLFFHPITWWISKQIREERENCCDDASILSNRDRRNLAEALAQLESLRLTLPTTITSAHGGSLMKRISRIIEAPTSKGLARLGSRSFFLGSLSLVLIAAGVTNLGMASSKVSVPESMLSSEIEQDKAITKEDYARMEAELREAVKSGRLSQKEMTSKLEGMRRRMVKAADKQGEKVVSFTREEYAAAEAKLKAMVASGEVTREAADRRLGEMRRRMAAAVDSKADKVVSFTREEYAAAEAKLKAMVASGEVTREAADRRLGEMRRRMAAAADSKADKVVSFTREEYAAAEAKLKAMVASGEVTREAADRRLGEMRRRMAAAVDSKADKVVSFTREEYAAAEAKIKAMVASGEVTREAADRRLEGMRRRMAKAADKKAEKVKTITRADYARAKKMLDGMVKANEVSREEADIRLAEMRRMIADDQPAKSKVKAPEDFNWDEVKARTEGAVEAGEMTREEADARYAGIKKRLDGSRDEAAMARRRLDHANAEAKIKLLVAEGKVSAEDAETRLRQMREGLRTDNQVKAFSVEEYKEAEIKIKAMVASGEVTREAADRRLEGMRRRMGKAADKKAEKGVSFTREEYAAAEAKLKAMVTEGKISEADAERRLGEMRRLISTAKKTRVFSEEEYARTQEELKKLVSEGRVSEADAKLRLERMRRAIDIKKEGGVKPRLVPEEEHKRYSEELKKLVEGGKLTKEEAEKKLAANTKAHIEKSVKSGEMTRAEADKLYKKLGIR